MIRRLVFFLTAHVVVATVGAAALERDLGLGLAYVRAKQLPADLPTKPTGKVPPCVIDVRYTDADAVAVTTFVAWLRFRATARTPVFVLANAATSAVLLDALANRGAVEGAVVIGVPGGRFRPDSAVKSETEDERKAYEALEGGAALEALLADYPDKVRNDEASLVRGQSGSGDTPVDLPAENSARRRNTPTIDVALQRAVHLHRALVALKKL